jgi:hypothetical protein
MVNGSSAFKTQLIQLSVPQKVLPFTIKRFKTRTANPMIVIPDRKSGTVVEYPKQQQNQIITFQKEKRLLLKKKQPVNQCIYGLKSLSLKL